MALCVGGYPYGLNEKCFSKTTKNGDIIKVDNGCFYDLKVEDQEACVKSEDCKICEGDRCNKDSGPITMPGPITTAGPITTPTKKPDPIDKDFQCNICQSDITGQDSCAFELKDDKYHKKCGTVTTNEERACFVNRLGKIFFV